MSTETRLKEYMSKIPSSMQGIITRAFTKKGFKDRVKAKCLDCCCFQREEVKECKSVTCPLHQIRPYQDKDILE